jgi:phosphatidylglycerophosphatase A
VRAVFRFLATFGPVGSAPLAPATAGSAVVAAIGWFIPPPALLVAIACIAVGTGLAIWFAGEAEKDLGHDAKPIVVDEAVGQSLALLLVPHRIWAFAAAFLLFRIFDVWKPLGAREAQRLPGGIGVVADDVIAGLTACGAFHLVWFALRRAGFVLT